MKLQHLNKKRLILVDLDGTALMNNGTELHEKTKNSLLKAKEQGHTICIITGRPHRASIRFYRELGLDTLLINFDGAHIHDPLKRHFKRIVLPISQETVSGIINNPIVKEVTENILIESYNKAIVKEKDEFIENFFHLDDVEGDNYFIANPYTSWEGSATNVVLVLPDESRKDDVLRALESFKNTTKIQSGNVYGNLSKKSKCMITLTNKLVNKGFASNILAQYYNKDIRDVIAFGDQMNDYEMLLNVGYGIAMKNGNDDLKNIAAGITQESNNDGGLGLYLDTLLAGEEV